MPDALPDPIPVAPENFDPLGEAELQRARQKRVADIHEMLRRIEEQAAADPAPSKPVNIWGRGAARLLFFLSFNFWNSPPFLVGG